MGSRAESGESREERGGRREEGAVGAGVGLWHNKLMAKYFKWRYGLKVFGLLLLTVGIFIILLTAWAVAGFNRRNGDRPMTYGVSYSVKYARELGVDQRAAYLALLDDLRISRFRLMSYWDEAEPEPGRYNFEELDWQMEQAARAGAKVSLAIGLRQPRYPECHPPGWFEQLPPGERKQALYGYITKVVERYRYHPALESWQLENEALNKVFGLCKDFDRRRLVEEFALVKRLDPIHPVIVNVSNEYGLPVRAPRGDEVGFSVYHTVFEHKILKNYVNYPFTPLFFRARAALIEWYWRRPVMIHELQGEPWGRVATSELSLEEQDQSMNAAKLKASAEFARDTGIREADLWGGEWWYWRKVKFNDPSLWEAARDIYAPKT